MSVPPSTLKLLVGVNAVIVFTSSELIVVNAFCAPELSMVTVLPETVVVIPVPPKILNVLFALVAE